MAQERIFTDEDRDWLKENYPHLSNKKCLLHLKCGYESLKKLVQDCGLIWKNTNNQKKPTKKPNTNGRMRMSADIALIVVTMSKEACSKSGKWVGALWQKKCFNK